MKETDITEVIELLKSYVVYKQQLFAEKYAKTYFDPYKVFQPLNDEGYQKKMTFVKSLIESFAPSNIATLLNLRYINGLTIDQCAECMSISRAEAYRLLRRAHVAVSNRYQRMKGATDERN